MDPPYDEESSDDEPPMLVQLDETAAEAVEEDENHSLDPMTSASPPTSQAALPSAEVDLPPCPVTILSGFLGSGKTTLIQYILKSPDHGKRIAVIENEYGQGLAIESLIARDGVDNSSLAGFIELPNGCICCTVKDSLVTTLENLLTKRQDLDYILIECSGMANPGPIASLFWLDDALDSRLRLDGIVTLCDAANIERQLQETHEAAQQIAYADRILLNKMDLVKPTEQDKDANAAAERITTLIRQFHPTAPLRQTSFASVPDLDWILDANCFEGEKKLWNDIVDLPVVDAAQRATQQESGISVYCQPCAPPTPHLHTVAIATISIVRRGSVDRQKLDRWLASILWPDQDEKNSVLRGWLENQTADHETDFQGSSKSKNQQTIFRVKGVVSMAHSSTDENDAMAEDFSESHIDSQGRDRRRYIVQGVHDLWEIHPAGKASEWEIDEERMSKIIVIGRFLDAEKLNAGFDQCLV